MSRPKTKSDPWWEEDQEQDQEQKQDQDQKQDQLQAQLQGQAQGQGQFQFAVQSVDTKVDSENKNENENENKNESKNENENDNENKNENTNEVKNEVDNKLDNSVDNKVDNEIDNKVENHVENKVEVKVDVDLDLDLSAFERPSDDDIIDVDEIKDISSSVIMPDAVTQTLTGNGNQFNIDQVNNLYDRDQANDPDVYMSSGEFKWDVKAEGGDVKLDDPKVDIDADGGTFGDGLAATADGIVSQEAFTQNIVMGANIQFNNIEMSVAGNDLTDDHSI